MPIYWDDDSILEFYNNKNYIRIRDESEFDEKIRYIIKINQNDILII